MSDTVRIVEMGARDGLQNEKTPVRVADRIAFIHALVGAGLNIVEVGAFVSPKAIPQMVGSDEVLRGVNRLPGEFHVLVPNLKGYEAAFAAGAKVVSVFAAASEGFSRANINCSIAESIERFKPVVARAKVDKVRVRGYVSCVLGCPFDGEIRPQAVADVAKKLWDLGCYEISLGDTIGVGTPSKAKEMLRAVAAEVPPARLAMHFHDTYGQALANLYAGMEEGVRVIDSAPRQLPAPDSVKRAIDLLKTAKRPLVLLGKGASYSQADKEIRAFIEKTGIPYLPMSMAKGLLPDTH